MLKLYLIGSMSNLTFEEANKPRRQFADKIEVYDGFHILNPCMGWDYDNFYEYTPKEVVAHNDMFLENSDIGIAFNTYPLNISTSVGSLYEIFYYKRNPSKPLFLIGAMPNYKPHIYESVTKCFKTDDECIDYLVSIYGQLA